MDTNTPLALLGGTPVIDAPLAPFRSVGEEEAQAAAQVVRGGVLSAYIGAAVKARVTLVEMQGGKLAPARAAGCQCRAFFARSSACAVRQGHAALRLCADRR